MSDDRDLRARVDALERWSAGAQAIIETLLGSVDHIHDDIVGMREWMRIPRPECYPAAGRHQEEEEEP